MTFIKPFYQNYNNIYKNNLIKFQLKIISLAIVKDNKSETVHMQGLLRVLLENEVEFKNQEDLGFEILCAF